MKITGVRTQPYTLDLQRGIGDANDPVGNARMPMLAVWIDCDDGISGIAISSPAAQPHIHAMVETHLIGRDPRGVRGHWQRLMNAAFKGSNRGLANAAISAIDIALWDLKAKLNHEPLWKTLGASTRNVRAYASGIELNLSNVELGQYYRRMAALGMHAGKLKVGLDRERDMTRIGIMRDALATTGKTPLIMVDSNEYWSPKQAIQHLNAYAAEYEIFWAEEPARRWDAAGLRQVRDGVRAMVTTGENLDDISEFRPLVEARAADVFQIGSKTGGITGCMMVADLCHAFETPVSLMNCAAHHMAHVAAVLPNHIFMECAMLGRSDGLIGNHPITDGWITLSDRPGLGIEFDEARLRAMPLTTGGKAGSWGRRRGANLLPLPPNEPEERGEE